ncbi:MAG TPA: DUF305 domain-containing protein, partial [Gemmatimonadaceae bacterium]
MSPSRLAAWPLALLAVSACTAAPGPAPDPAPSPAPAASPARRAYTEADVRFVREMIAHHAQALAMTALVPERTRRADMRLLAERIETTQRTEIAMMRSWLRARGEALPDSAAPAHHRHDAQHEMAGGAARMPGMLSAEEMDRLAAARDEAFDRLLLEFMIRHHEGALTMVAALFATPGAGEESEMFRLA